MKAILIFVVQFLLISNCIAQTMDEPSVNKIKFTVAAGAGRSLFATKMLSQFPKTEPNTEVRFGMGMVKPIGKYFDLISGLNIGVKIKGDRAYSSSSSVKLISPFTYLEEAVNSRNHYFVEIPLLVQFSILKKKIGFRAGGNYRNFSPNKGYENSGGPDFLSNRKELGILTGVSIRLVDNLKLSASYCFGTTPVYAADVEGGSFGGFLFDDYRVRNQFSQFTLEYVLGKRLTQ